MLTRSHLTEVALILLCYSAKDVLAFELIRVVYSNNNYRKLYRQSQLSFTVNLNYPVFPLSDSVKVSVKLAHFSRYLQALH